MLDETGERDPDTSDVEEAELLEVLGEQYSAAILAATDSPLSARELSDMLDVPIATCYRRIEDLVDVGLLVEDGQRLSDHGRRTSVYRRSVDEVTVLFEKGEPTVSVAPASDGRVRRKRDAVGR
ncbi:MAG: helix-turn-helix domain-containing protein [Halobacteriales archaeon]